MRLFRRKKGVSPLIATVLLIAFAVALGAVVMNWGRTYVEDTADFASKKSDVEVKCSMDVGIDVVRIDGTQQMCYGGSGEGGYLDTMLENTGNVKVEKMQLAVIGSKGIYVNTTLNGTDVDVAGIIHLNLSYNMEDYGDIKQVKFTPHMKLGGVDTPCSDNALVRSKSQLLSCNSTYI